MISQRLRLACHLAAAAFLALAPHHPALAACASERVDVGGYKLWANVAGHGRPTVILESGNGNDSTVWGDIEPRIRALGVTTLVYDRSGLGQSDLRPGPYHIAHDAEGLEHILNKCGVSGPLILVAHSYGGFVSARVATENRNVKGLILLDADVVTYWNDATLAALLARYRPQYDEVRTKAPQLAQVVIPIVEGHPETVKLLQAEPLPLDLPVIDIVAEKTWLETPEETAAWRKAHSDFVAASPARQLVFADGSGHKVMKDKPDLVIDAIKQMIARVDPVASTK